MKVDPVAVNHLIVDRLRQRRMEAGDEGNGLSQRQLAQLAGISPTTISNLEREAQYVSIEHLYRLCAALGIEPADIIPNVSEAGRASESAFHDDDDHDAILESVPDDWAELADEVT